ncbi:hypothetical protein TNCV_3324471 [Trichonephila clavipes]|nr:hypothetical protein TNCV_3324471 [Trichonephila clavipes]
MQEKPRSAGRDANDSPRAAAEGGSGSGCLPESSAGTRSIVCGEKWAAVSSRDAALPGRWKVLMEPGWCTRNRLEVGKRLFFVVVVEEWF